MKSLGPALEVPAMKDGDFCLAESNAILRYLAATYGPWHGWGALPWGLAAAYSEEETRMARSEKNRQNLKRV